MIKKIFLLILIASCASTTLPFFETNTEKMFKLYAKISEIIKSLTTKKTSYATTLTTNNKKQGEVLESGTLSEFQNDQSSKEEGEINSGHDQKEKLGKIGKTAIALFCCCWLNFGTGFGLINKIF